MAVQYPPARQLSRAQRHVGDSARTKRCARVQYAAVRPAARRMSAHGEVVLASKVTAPVLPDWVVPRARIDRRISEGACGPVTVVTGPPGAGKTTALASWAAAGTG